VGLIVVELDKRNNVVAFHPTAPHGSEPYKYITVEDEGALTWIVLDRQDRANALSNEMLDEFSDALQVLKDLGGPVLAIRGAGKGFSAGYDIGEVGVPRKSDPVSDEARLQRNVDRYLAIWDHPKPVIAAVHGYCIAGATQLCVFADITIVAEDARIGEPTIPIGGGYVAPLWAPLVGPKRAKELSFVPGNSIDGRTAVEWGWANHAVPTASLLDTVRSLAQRIALMPPEVLAVKKLSINRAMEAMGVRTATAEVSKMDARLHTTPSVLAVRQRIRDEGLRTVMEAYRVPPTSDLAAGRLGSANDIVNAQGGSVVSVETAMLYQTVRELVDKDAIKTVMFDYAFYLDMNMTEDLAALFTHDCIVTYGPGFEAEGKKEYRTTLEGVGTYFAATSHHVSNVVVSFSDEDTATVRSVLLAWHRYNRTRPDGYVLGQYHDILVRTPEGWRFKRRELRHAGTIDYHVKPDHQTMIDRRT
jgi:enoyl-CoA hydratase